MEDLTLSLDLVAHKWDKNVYFCFFVNGLRSNVRPIYKTAALCQI